MKTYRALLTASMVLALAAAPGCSGDTGNVVDNGKVVAGLNIDPDITTMDDGEMRQFTAVVEYADGTTLDVTRDPSTIWNTTDPGVASVSATGMVTALDEGTVSITADYKGEKSDESFAVTP